MAQFSFDIVSDYNKAEMNNVFDQVRRDIDNRYDFKDTSANLEWLNTDKNGFKITGDSNYQIDAILDLARKKLASRGLSQKIFDITKECQTSNLKTTKEVPFIQGLDQEKAKKVTKIIRDNFPKIKTQIQGDSVRVMASTKNDLQACIAKLQQQDLNFPINFTNYR